MEGININYKPGIKNFLSDITGNFTISRCGIDLLNRLLINLNSNLVNKTLDNASGASSVTVMHASNSVDAFFPGNLKALAFAEGSRVLSLFSNGLIEYKPEKKKFKRKKKKKSKQASIDAAKEFTCGVSDLTSLIFPLAALPTRTSTLLCEMLEEFAVKLSDFIQDNGGDSIKKEDVRDAIGNLLPDQMSKHAIAEGTRMTFLHEARKRGRLDRKRKRTSDTASPEFTSGVTNLMSFMFPHVSLPAQPTAIICEMLEEVALNISDFIQTKAGNSINEEHIRDAIVNLLPEEMSHHAIAEGGRNILLYEAGGLETVGKRRRTTATGQARKRSTKRH